MNTNEERQQGEALAKDFHDTYERLAPKYGYQTREESRKEWDQVPERNRKLMIATATEVFARFLQARASQEPRPDFTGMRESAEKWSKLIADREPRPPLAVCVRCAKEIREHSDIEPRPASGELRERAQKLAADILVGKHKCPICNWQLADSRHTGCVVGDCSYRSDDPQERQRLTLRRHEFDTLTDKLVAFAASEREQWASVEERLPIVGCVISPRPFEKQPAQPDTDYSCGSAYCDDPACNLHGPKDADGNLLCGAAQTSGAEQPKTIGESQVE